MRIQENDIIRDMRQDEIDSIDPEKSERDALAEDYENALAELGVRFGD